MTRIEKKAWPDLFEKVLSGDKTFDMRLADWKISPGDILALKEFDPVKNEYTGRSLEKTVTFVLRTKDQKFFSKEKVDKYGFQVISFK